MNTPLSSSIRATALGSVTGTNCGSKAKKKIDPILPACCHADMGQAREKGQGGAWPHPRASRDSSVATGQASLPLVGRE